MAYLTELCCCPSNSYARLLTPSTTYDEYFNEHDDQTNQKNEIMTAYFADPSISLLVTVV